MSDATILLVEDNPDDSELMLHALQQWSPSTVVVVARDGVEALELLFGEDDSHATTVPRLVILDLMLPKLGGLAVLKAIREHPSTEFVPVVILSSSSEDRDVLESYRLKANSYVRKPSSFSQFTDTLRQMVLYWLTLNTAPAGFLIPYRSKVISSG